MPQTGSFLLHGGNICRKLLQTDGVNPALLAASGFSEYRPVAGNDPPEGRSKNRRMEIILMLKSK
jgi:chemotaxis protein MotB